MRVNDQQKFRDAMDRAAMYCSWRPSWQQTMLGGKAHPNHISPNGASYCSMIHAAEAWMLSHHLPIFTSQYPHLYQAMLDTFSDSGDYGLWEMDAKTYYKETYARRDKR